MPSLAQTQRRRVLFILPSLGGGGAERAVVNLLRHFDRSRFEPHLALLEKSGPYLKDLAADVPVHDLKTPRVRYAIPALVRLAWKLRPVAVLPALRELNLALLMAKTLLPPRSKLMIQEVVSASAYLAQASRHPEVWRWLYRHLYRRADKVICVADYVLNDLANEFGVSREKMVRIYYWVDVDQIRRLAEACGNPYFSTCPRLVAAGRLTEQKGFDVLLNAMKVVHQAFPAARLTILGEGPLESILKAQAERLGLRDVVHFAGFQLNPYPCFKHADLFVLSSRYEGLPNVILEALALGTPVVAMDCPGGVREILDGCALGWLVTKPDALKLAQTIISALGSSKNIARGGELVESIISRFGIERAVRDYETLLSA